MCTIKQKSEFSTETCRISCLSNQINNVQVWIILLRGFRFCEKLLFFCTTKSKSALLLRYRNLIFWSSVGKNTWRFAFKPRQNLIYVLLAFEPAKKALFAISSRSLRVENDLKGLLASHFPPLTNHSPP